MAMVRTKMGTVSLISSGTQYNLHLTRYSRCVVHAVGNVLWARALVSITHMCTDVCTKLDCDNIMVVEEAIEIDYGSDEDNEY